MSPESSAVAVICSDASDSGFGGYLVQCGSEFVSSNWPKHHVSFSSTLKELLAVKFVLLSLLSQLAGLTVKWFTDNQNIPKLISCGSSKAYLQSKALSIYYICCNHSISIEMEWIPRSKNDQPDSLSHLLFQ